VVAYGRGTEAMAARPVPVEHRMVPDIVGYLRAGFALVPIPAGLKGPRDTGWQHTESAIRIEEDARRRLNNGNVGVAHRWSGTCAIDIDDYGAAVAWLSGRGVDLDVLFLAEDAVQIRSGRPNRGKLLYRLPDRVEWLPTEQPRGSGLELRCATRDGAGTVQDLLPPSTHPDTGAPYEWAGEGHWDALPVLPSAVLVIWQGIGRPQGSGGIP
jgi:bifunctional DNA primase/polymerase-like protein